MAVRETELLVAKLREFDVPVTTLVVHKVIEDARRLSTLFTAAGGTARVYSALGVAPRP